MMRINNKGFTLIELIVTIVLLTVLMGIGGYSIINIMEGSKEEDYQLLLENINSAVELYYQECTFVTKTCSNPITLGFLVENGYLKGNSTNDDDTFTLVNPKDNNNISSCEISYTENNGVITVSAVNPSDSCPTSY